MLIEKLLTNDEAVFSGPQGGVEARTPPGAVPNAPTSFLRGWCPSARNQ